MPISVAVVGCSSLVQVFCSSPFAGLAPFAAAPDGLSRRSGLCSPTGMGECLVWVKVVCSVGRVGRLGEGVQITPLNIERRSMWIVDTPNPCRILGAASFEMSDSDPLLMDPSLQNVPGGDGEVFSTVVSFSMLTFDKSYVIAERFTIRCINATSSVDIGQIYPESDRTTGASPCV